MVCSEVLDRLSPYLDDELDSWASREVAKHMESCPSCSAAFARRKRLGENLRDHLEYHRAPELLRARILRDVRAGGSRSARPGADSWRWLSTAAAVIAVAGGTWLFATMPLLGTGDAVTREAVSSHVRSLMASHLTDVASTDQHTVKPWFAGRLDYSPPVTDFASAGYPLVGGRLEDLGGRSVAALVYQHRKHVINVFVWPEARERRLHAATRRGFNAIFESHAGMAYCVVSDLNAAELAAFTRMVTGAGAPQR